MGDRKGTCGMVGNLPTRIGVQWWANCPPYGLVRRGTSGVGWVFKPPSARGWCGRMVGWNPTLRLAVKHSCHPRESGDHVALVATTPAFAGVTGGGERPRLCGGDRGVVDQAIKVG